MINLKSLFKFIIILAGIATISITLLSLLYDIHYWWIKVIDFPRLQLLIASLVILVFFAILNRRWNFSHLFFAFGLLCCIGIQSWFVVPYTIFIEKEVEDSPSEVLNEKKSFSLLIANVYLKNRNADAFRNQIEEKSPDLLLVVETDEWWLSKLDSVAGKYKYSLKRPLNNTYGMLLYSKHPLIEPQIKYLQHQQVPSFHTKIKLPDGQEFYFHGVHPVPPIPDNYPDNVGERERALLMVGDMVTRQDLPAVVAGDFNDVAWSYTTRMFQAEGKLHDVRVGRGLFNTFNAHSLVLRWPLDHIFVTKQFSVVALERLPEIGSDHFPLYIVLALN